jgi:two-component system chemotaxis sensor kinase CheA
MLEQTGQREVVQYRGQIMSLLRLSDCLGGAGGDAPDTEHMQVVVYSEQGRSMGLIIGKIIDIVEDAVRLQNTEPTTGRRGQAIIQNRVTELLDVPSLVRQFLPEFASAA